MTRITAVALRPIPPNATAALRQLMLGQYRRDLAAANPKWLKPDGAPRGWRARLVRMMCPHDSDYRHVWSSADGRIITCLNCGRTHTDDGNRPPQRTPPPPKDNA